jgi:hypothetical protein
MPLMKRATTNGSTTTATPPPAEAAKTQAPAASELPKTTKHTRETPMTKDDYWRRREERDIETGVRIRRSGVIQAAAMSVGTSQYNTGSTIESYADVVEKLAERMLAWVNR